MMKREIWLPAIAVLCAGVCFGDPDVNINININVNGGDESKEPGDGSYGGAGGSGGPPWGGGGGSGGSPFGGTPDGWKPASDGPCPAVIPVVQNFNITKYLGLWYEVERMYNPFTTTDCVTAYYSLKEDGNVKVVNSNGQNRTTDDTIVGTAVPSNGTEGLLTVSFPMTSGGYQGPPPTGPNYNILLTDYDNYAVVYTCDTFQIPGAPVETKLEFGWILSRTTNISEASILNIKNDIDSLNIDSERFNQTNQEGCPRLPIE